MIRKQRKAQWLYECRTCDYTSPVTTDLFGAQENHLRHERTGGHTFKMIGQAFQAIVDVFAETAKTSMSMTERFQRDFALVPPPNLPHDPALRGDRRKWGGR